MYAPASNASLRGSLRLRLLTAWIVGNDSGFPLLPLVQLAKVKVSFVILWEFEFLSLGLEADLLALGPLRDVSHTLIADTAPKDELTAASAARFHGSKHHAVCQTIKHLKQQFIDNLLT